MQAIAYQTALPISDPHALQDVTLPDPTPGPHDLLVEVPAIAVKPVDTKGRASTKAEPGGWKVLGWGAVGEVRAVGSAVTLFQPGQRVWYAGAINRPGATAQLHLVDESIAAVAPTSLADADAAALPLTAITAWELLFDRLGIARDTAAKGDSLLV